jgi:hypothetical protein
MAEGSAWLLNLADFDLLSERQVFCVRIRVRKFFQNLSDIPRTPRLPERREWRRSACALRARTTQSGYFFR